MYGARGWWPSWCRGGGGRGAERKGALPLRCDGVISEKQLCAGIRMHGQDPCSLTFAGLQTQYAGYRLCPPPLHKASKTGERLDDLTRHAETLIAGDTIIHAAEGRGSDHSQARAAVRRTRTRAAGTRWRSPSWQRPGRSRTRPCRGGRSTAKRGAAARHARSAVWRYSGSPTTRYTGEWEQLQLAHPPGAGSLTSLV